MTVTKNILFDQDDRVVKIMKIITLTVYIKLKNNIRKCDLKWQKPTLHPVYRYNVFGYFK